MKKHNVQHPYILAALVAMVGIGVGIGIRFVTAATFTDPGCDPTASGGPTACNQSGPLLLDPKDATTTQVINSPVQFGTSAAGRDITLYGDIRLTNNKRIISEATFLGTGIDITSSGEYAIIGRTSASNKAGLYGIGTGAAPGIQATSDSGTALLATSVSGKAAVFSGAVDVNGETNITGLLKVNGATVNPGAGTAGVVSATSPASATPVVVNLATQIFPGQQYQVNSITVQYASTAVTGTRTWRPMPYLYWTYAECATSAYSGNLSLTNPSMPLEAVDYRIVVNYSPTTVSCGDATAPVISELTGLTANHFYKGTHTVGANASDAGGSGMARVEFFADAATTPYATDSSVTGGWTSSLNTTTLSNNYTTFNPTPICPTGTTPHTIRAIAYDVAGNASTPSTVNICVTNQSGVTPCGPLACGGTTPQCCTSPYACRSLATACAIGSGDGGTF